MSDFNIHLFSDPYIQLPSDPFHQNSTRIQPSPLQPALPKPSTPQHEPKPSLDPEISSNLLDLSNPTLIVYRSGKACAISSGPNIIIPVFNCEIQDGVQQGNFNINCISTYPNFAPYSPIADRFEIRHFKDSFILVLADGCGLHPSSRLAPKSAIDGFWKDLIPRLQDDKGQIDVHKFGQHLKAALKAAHFNIYWEAYARNQDGFSDLKNTPYDESYSAINALTQRKEHLIEELSLIQKALDGDFAIQRALIEKNLESKFYEGYAGATTFLCSALLKNPSNTEFPFLLFTLNLGDGQCFLYRDNELIAMTQDTRSDLSNLRDPGGKMGLCTPTPLKLDDRNMQFSTTPCKSGDFLLFMTDGVLDNLNPERLGFLPQGDKTPFWIQETICNASGLSIAELQPILEILDAPSASWKTLDLNKSNQLHRDFTRAFLKLIVDKTQNLDEVNNTLVRFCHTITKGHRNNSSKSSNSLYGYSKPLGKPDHTTCLSYLIP